MVTRAAIGQPVAVPVERKRVWLASWSPARGDRATYGRMPPPLALLTSFEIDELRRLARDQHPALMQMQHAAGAGDLSCEAFVDRVTASTPLEMVNELRRLVADESGRGPLGQDPSRHVL
jgi:hypothetical protein